MKFGIWGQNQGRMQIAESNEILEIKDPRNLDLNKLFNFPSEVNFAHFASGILNFRTQIKTKWKI